MSQSSPAIAPVGKVESPLADVTAANQGDEGARRPIVDVKPVLSRDIAER